MKNDWWIACWGGEGERYGVFFAFRQMCEMIKFMLVNNFFLPIFAASLQTRLHASFVGFGRLTPMSLCAKSLILNNLQKRRVEVRVEFVCR